MTVSEAKLKPGWLQRQMRENNIQVAMWPTEWLEVAGISLDTIPASERREAARRLRARAKALEDGLEP